VTGLRSEPSAGFAVFIVAIGLWKVPDRSSGLVVVSAAHFV
jgi:hypothetical protein